MLKNISLFHTNAWDDIIHHANFGVEVMHETLVSYGSFMQTAPTNMGHFIIFF
jgi:hypothetical protein